MYVDYEYYSINYGGKVSSTDFTTLEIKASGILNYYTFNRIEEVTEDIKLTICELVDYLKELENKGGKEIASESVSTHSVTYAAKDNTSTKKKQKEIINKYLAHTNLLYRGV